MLPRSFRSGLAGNNQVGVNQASLVGVELISLGVVDLDKLDAGKKHCIRLCWEQEGSGRSVFTSNTISGIVGME